MRESSVTPDIRLSNGTLIQHRRASNGSQNAFVSMPGRGDEMTDAEWTEYCRIIRVERQLLHAVTAYDTRQSKKPAYNRFALPQYLERVRECVKDIYAGTSPRQALCAGFNGRLLDRMLKAIGEAPFTRAEVDNGGPWYYVPASSK